MPQPDADAGDSRSDTRNAGTDLNSHSYQIPLAGWAALCLRPESRLAPDEAFKLSSTLEDS